MSEPTVYMLKPVPKPRITQRDKWKKRPCVMRYREFKDECRRQRVKLPDSSRVVFLIAMPKSWSEKKKAAMMGERHRQKPDIDNLQKALLDAVYEDDSAISEIHAIKIWSQRDAIMISEIKGYPRISSTDEKLCYALGML